MESAIRVQTSALLEALPVGDLPLVAAAALEAWCVQADGATHDDIGTFLIMMISSCYDGGMRQLLVNLISSYESGRLVTN